MDFLPPHGRWQAPPEDLPPEVWTVTHVRGAQGTLVRAAVLGFLDEGKREALALSLTGGAAELLRHAPDPESWIPVSELHMLLMKGEEASGTRIRETIARLAAERDAGLLPWMPDTVAAAFLDVSTPEAFLERVGDVYRAYFQGGSAQLDALAEGEAWVSFWMQELLPGFGERDLLPWFRRALERHSGCPVQVTYVPAPPGKPWWHRFHFQWSR